MRNHVILFQEPHKAPTDEAIAAILKPIGMRPEDILEDIDALVVETVPSSSNIHALFGGRRV